MLQRSFRTNLSVLEPSEEHSMPRRIRTQPHRAQIHDEQTIPYRREPVRDRQPHDTQHALHDRHSGPPGRGFKQSLEVTKGEDAAPSDIVQVEPSEPNVFDVVPFLEIEEVWCDEGLVGGILDPVRGRFFGRSHSRGEATRWRAQEKKVLIM